MFVLIHDASFIWHPDCNAYENKKRELTPLYILPDILHIASLSLENSKITEATRLHLKCFHRSFSGNLSDSTCLCDLPTSNKPIDGPGILINLLGRDRWLPFATWIIKFLSKCLTEGTLYVEGLMNTSFVSAACSLLCYGDADLQMVGFMYVWERAF